MVWVGLSCYTRTLRLRAQLSANTLKEKTVSKATEEAKRPNKPRSTDTKLQR